VSRHFSEVRFYQIVAMNI